MIREAAHLGYREQAKETATDASSLSSANDGTLSTNITLVIVVEPSTAAAQTNRVLSQGFTS